VSSKDFGVGMALLPSIIMQKVVNSFRTAWKQNSKRKSHIVSTASRSVVSYEYCGEAKGQETKWLTLKTISFRPSKEMLIGRKFRNGGSCIRHFAML